MIAPELERVESNIKAVKVDVDEFEDLARKYGVMSIPTLILFEDGKEIKRNIGFMDKDKGCPFVCVGHYVIQCIPYEGNEHLLGKTDACNEFYKTWE